MRATGTANPRRPTTSTTTSITTQDNNSRFAGNGARVQAHAGEDIGGLVRGQ